MTCVDLKGEKRNFKNLTVKIRTSGEENSVVDIFVPKTAFEDVSGSETK